MTKTKLFYCLVFRGLVWWIMVLKINQLTGFWASLQLARPSSEEITVMLRLADAPRFLPLSLTTQNPAETCNTEIGSWVASASACSSSSLPIKINVHTVWRHNSLGFVHLTCHLKNFLNVLDAPDRRRCRPTTLYDSGINWDQSGICLS